MFLTLTLGKVTQCVAQHPVHHVTDAFAKLMLLRLTVKRCIFKKYSIWPWSYTRYCPVPYTSCDLCTCKVWSWSLMVWEEMHLQEYTLFDLWLWPSGQGHTKCRPVPSTSCDICMVWSCYVQWFGGSAVAQWLSAWLETEGPRVRASRASMRCGPWARHIYPSLVLVQPILARSHTFVEIDHEIISTVILLPSADSFKKGCCQLQAKVCAQITG